MVEIADSLGIAEPSSITKHFTSFVVGRLLLTHGHQNSLLSAAERHFLYFESLATEMTWPSVYQLVVKCVII